MRREQEGFALVEAILLALVLIVPLVWLLGMLAHVHRAALGTTAAAREAGFAVARDTTGTAGPSGIDMAVARALRDQHLDVRRARVGVSLPNGTERGGAVHIEIVYPVPMLDLPIFDRLPSISVSVEHDVIIDRYRSR